MPLNPWRKKKRIKWKTENLLFNILNNFGAWEEYWSIERIHASNVLQSFFHTCKVFYMKSFDYTSIHLIEIKKKSRKQVNVICKCYFVYSPCITVTYFLCFFIYILGNNFRKFIDFCSYFFYACFKFITFFLLSYHFEWVWNCKRKFPNVLNIIRKLYRYF